MYNNPPPSNDLAAPVPVIPRFNIGTSGIFSFGMAMENKPIPKPAYEKS